MPTLTEFNLEKINGEEDNMVTKKKEHKNKSMERNVYYYKVICNCGGNNLNAHGLAIPFYDKFYFLEIVQHEYDKDIYQGKFYSLRFTDFPYLLNGNRQEIVTSDDDTLMEQTHFCCLVSKNIIVSEFNFHGVQSLCSVVTILIIPYFSYFFFSVVLTFVNKLYNSSLWVSSV